MTLEQQFIEALDRISSICTPEQIQDADTIISIKTPSLWNQVPNNHVWRKKEHHGKKTEQEGRGILASMGVDTEKNCGARLALFCAKHHDHGRVIEVKYGNKIFPQGFEQGATHGGHTMTLLYFWGALKPFRPDVIDIIHRAIATHSDKISPEMPPEPSPIDQAATLFAWFTRDIDKLTFYHHEVPACIFSNQERIGQSKIIHEGYNENYSSRDNFISPEILKSYLTRMTDGGKTHVERADMRNNCDYMLQVASQICDVKYNTILQEIIKTNAIQLILGYLSHIQTWGIYKDILSATRQYLISRGVAGENFGEKPNDYYNHYKHSFNCPICKELGV